MNLYDLLLCAKKMHYRKYKPTHHSYTCSALTSSRCCYKSQVHRLHTENLDWHLYVADEKAEPTIGKTLT